MTDAANPSNDESAHDESALDESALDESALDQIDERIDRTRQHAVDAGILPDDDQKFHESGTIRPDLDDQTIAPPG